MSTHIGTNFSYDAENFLDERQGTAKAKDDLKNWDTPVPESFEVCLDKIWYYYDPNITLDDTGHWIPRISTQLGQLNNDTRPISANIVKSISDNLNTVSTKLSNL